MKPPQIYYNFIRPFQYLYYFLIRPKTYGVKVLIRRDNKFLFIRNTYYLKHWTFPGGGIEKNESPEQSARRETLEETGISISKLTLIGTYKSTRHYKRDTVYCFYGETKQNKISFDPREVLEAKWIGIKHFPTPRSFAVDEVLSLYQANLQLS